MIRDDAAVAISDVVCLGSKESQVVDAVVSWVQVSMVNDFGWQQVSAEVVLHGNSVLKRVFAAAGVSFAWVWVVVRNVDQLIPVFARSSAPVPSWGLLATFAVHPICCAFPAFTEHRVALA